MAFAVHGDAVRGDNVPNSVLLDSAQVLAFLVRLHIISALVQVRKCRTCADQALQIGTTSSAQHWGSAVTVSPSGIVKLFENDCGAVDVSLFGGQI
jgi:hypothetical protein